MLSSYRATYPFIRTTRTTQTQDGDEYLTTESEHGLITIDHETVIIEGQEYSLKSKKGKPAEASLNINSGKLVSITLKVIDGEKFFFIDPEHSLFSSRYQQTVSDSNHHHHIFSF